MKKFKEFLENYDVYIDKPKGFKKADTDIEIEQSTEEENSNEETATRVEPG
jgi:hypothetical protein